MKIFIISLLVAIPLCVSAQQKQSSSNSRIDKKVQNLDYDNDQIDQINPEIRKGGDSKSQTHIAQKASTINVQKAPEPAIVTHLDVLEKIYEASNVKLRILLRKQNMGEDLKKEIQVLRGKIQQLTVELENMDCNE